MKDEAIYWLAIAHLPRWGYGKINNLIVKFFHEEKITIGEFFSLPESEWADKYQLNPKEIEGLNFAKSELPNNAFLAEKLHNEGYELIPITSPDYSQTLKQNLKTINSPSLLYVKGNKKILQENSIAIVGARSASKTSLEFTDNIAKLASKDFKVVVSGFAKGVDKQALDSAVKHKGQSIIVLPQGITTFASGYKTYYKQIVQGDVLVLSTFHPNASWAVGLAMARNPIIYGLADEIYVAESNDKGGTWSGVIDGLKKERKIYVRRAEPGEKNANNLLIQKGAVPVDFNGIEGQQIIYNENLPETELVNEPTASFDHINEKIINIFTGKPLLVKEILEKTGLDWSAKKMTSHLQKMENIQTIKKGRTNQYLLKSAGSEKPVQASLFG